MKLIFKDSLISHAFSGRVYIIPDNSNMSEIQVWLSNLNERKNTLKTLPWVCYKINMYFK